MVTPTRHTGICFVLLAGLLSFLSCRRQPVPEISFYYWKTTTRFGYGERQVLSRNKVSRAYLRLFDIVVHKPDGIPVPDALLSPADTLPDSVQWVPVVFIRNEVWMQMHDTAEPQLLAARTATLIRRMMQRMGRSWTEVQFDCDWSEKTRGRYFAFLDAIRSEQAGISVSVTIRLHQVKYTRQQGVPPADRGILMYYNMGRINTGSSVSVYDREAAQRYLPYVRQYPLPLDVALPIFSWGIWIRNDQVKGLLNKTDHRDYADTAYFREEQPGRYIVKRSHYRKGFYLCAGDRVKLEELRAEQLYEMATDLRSQMKNPVHELIFYELDSFNTSRYESSLFQEVAHRF